MASMNHIWFWWRRGVSQDGSLTNLFSGGRRYEKMGPLAVFWAKQWIYNHWCHTNILWSRRSSIVCQRKVSGHIFFHHKLAMHRNILGPELKGRHKNPSQIDFKIEKIIKLNCTEVKEITHPISPRPNRAECFIVFSPIKLVMIQLDIQIL